MLYLFKCNTLTDIGNNIDKILYRKCYTNHRKIHIGVCRQNYFFELYIHNDVYIAPSNDQKSKRILFFDKKMDSSLVHSYLSTVRSFLKNSF